MLSKRKRLAQEAAAQQSSRLIIALRRLPINLLDSAAPITSIWSWRTTRWFFSTSVTAPTFQHSGSSTNVRALRLDAQPNHSHTMFTPSFAAGADAPPASCFPSTWPPSRHRHGDPHSLPHLRLAQTPR